MSLKDELFGPDKATIYEKLALDLGGSFNRVDYYKPIEVKVQYNTWDIEIGTKVVEEFFNNSAGNSYGGNADFTVITAAFIKTEDFQFSISPQQFLDTIFHLLGAQDITIGDYNFDKLYVVKSNDNKKVIELFSNTLIRELIIELKDVSLRLKNSEDPKIKSLNTVPGELNFKSEEVIVDLNKLKLLVKLFSDVLDQLKLMGIIREIKSV